MAKEEKSLVVFQDRKIRRVWYDGEWFFSVVDVVEALTDSPTPRQYWGKVKDREFLVLQLSPIWVRLKLLAEDGKLRETDCATTRNMFRIIQSIPSPKAEPFKLWLAKVGYERVQEIQDPELAHKRMIDIYQQKGYSDDWIKHRLAIMGGRYELTDEFKRRNVNDDVEFAILTNDISKAAFGKTVEEYKRFKGITRQNLRDHMTRLELIFTLLAEASAAEIARGKNSKGFGENRKVAREGGAVAGNARKELEQKSGRPVILRQNYLDEPEKTKRNRLR